jgi:hypothetical protein
MKQLSGQDEDHLTWANLFVNANYREFLRQYMPEFKKRSVNLVANKMSNTNRLVFKPKNIWNVGADAWLGNIELVSEIARYINTNNIAGELFLFAAGPLANLLTYELWSRCSKANTYIDIGSVLDPYLGLKVTRGYQLGAATLQKVCVW